MEAIFSQHGCGIERAAIAGSPPGISSPTAGVPLLKSTSSWLTYSALIGIGALNGFRNRLALLTGTPLDVLFEDVSGYCIDLVGIRTPVRVELQNIAGFARIAAQLLSGEHDFWVASSSPASSNAICFASSREMKSVVTISFCCFSNTVPSTASMRYVHCVFASAKTNR